MMLTRNMMATRKIRDIHLKNSLTRKKEILETLVPGKLTMYSCGPTVYGFIHIGNLRAALVSDLFYRYFKRSGYEVTYVRNYTDVDDKIIEISHQEKTTAEEVAKKYTQEVEKDYALAGLLEPTHKTTVTTHMPEIISMIEKIINQGNAYVVEGEVLFSIEKFKDYGKLSHKHIEDLVAGIRVEVDQKKKNPHDFALWKPAKIGEPFWESPWGRGRPGWHIECSAMSHRWLGEQIDVHHGGEDLIFPHHENEIAQSETASGKEPFVRYWLHNAFLTLSKEKMSKSLGNVTRARDFLERYGKEVTRTMLLTVHYRSPLDLNAETVENAITGLHRIYEAKSKACELIKQKKALPDLMAESLWGSFVASCEKTRSEIDDHFANDFNVSGALGALYTLIREFNRTLAQPLSSATPACVLGASELIRVMEEDIGGVLGIGQSDPEKILKEIAAMRGSTSLSEAEILQAIQAREEARRAKNFAESDRIRKELESKNVLIKDGPNGTTWEYR